MRLWLAGTAADLALPNADVACRHVGVLADALQPQCSSTETHHLVGQLGSALAKVHPP